MNPLLYLFVQTEAGVSRRECGATQFGDHLQLACVPLQEVASASFDPAQERIVDVTYPSALDSIHVRHSILGDDSVLVKYLNPHVALVTSISSAASSAAVSATATATASASAAEEASVVDGVEAVADGTLYWTLLDTVTGKVVLRLHQESGSLPVHSVLVENHIVSTYWNSKVNIAPLFTAT